MIANCYINAGAGLSQREEQGYTMTELPQEDALIGNKLGKDGRYLIKQKLGMGGMGSVYLAIDQTTQREWAVKILHDSRARDAHWVDRFKREGIRFSEIKHENVVKVKGFGKTDSSWFVVFEYIDGENLFQYEETPGSLAIDECLRICADVARGVHAVHELKFVHRDLKPENIMVRNGDGVVKVVDFGIAKSIDSDTVLTVPGDYVGTAGYSSPEQAMGKDIDHKSDIFSLGVILYELVTGQLAFDDGRTTMILEATVRTQPEGFSSSMNHVAKPIRKLIAEMVEKKPRHRPATMLEVSERLDEIQNSGTLMSWENEKTGISSFLKRFFEGK
ncbi:MAG: serine/threonine protein kinase [Planctomycetota bacterium]|jgi:serine/threonine protein kinase